MAPDSAPPRPPGAHGNRRDVRPSSNGPGHGLAFAAFVFGLVALAFLAGAAVVLTGVPPAKVLKDAHAAALALHDELTGYRDVFQTDLWRAARTGARGVTIHDADRAFDGLTLYTSGEAARATLVAMDGRIVHEWSLPYSAVWDETAAVRDPQPDSHIFMHKAHLFPNGDLLAVYEGSGDTPYGYGLVRMTKDSEVVWTYLAHTHHDVTVGGDGLIYVLTQEIRNNESELYPHLPPPRLDDFLAVLSPDGEELRVISLLDAVARSPYRRMLEFLPHAHRDPLHVNDVDWIDPGTAALLPFAEPGQLLLSLREPGAVAVLDIEREEVVWAIRGSWVAQHDPDLLATGNMLLFDNLGDLGGNGPSRVIEFDPVSGEVVWSYGGSEEAPLDSRLRSSQQRLPNGNTLITESDGGRILEVTRDGEIVWEFVNPVRGGADNRFVPVVSRAERVAPADLDPEFFRDLNVYGNER